jgi:hypothetical protein
MNPLRLLGRSTVSSNSHSRFALANEILRFHGSSERELPKLRAEKNPAVDPEPDGPQR